MSGLLRTTPGAALKEARENNGMTQSSLASAAEVSVWHISAIETGRTLPSVEFYERLARAARMRVKRRRRMIVYLVRFRLLESFGESTPSNPGTALRFAREISGKSITELAAEIGVHISYVSKVERGTTSPSKAMYEKLAEAAGMQPKQIQRWARIFK